MPLPLIAGILGAVGSAAGIGFGIADRIKGERETTRQQNNINWDQQFADKQFSYMQQQNDLTRQREDNAMQRKVADLKAAGLNPLMAVTTPGSSAQAMSTAGSNAPVGTPVRSSGANVPNIPIEGLMMASEMNLKEAQAQYYRDTGQAALSQASSSATSVQNERVYQDAAVQNWLAQNKLTESEIATTAAGQRINQEIANMRAQMDREIARIHTQSNSAIAAAQRSQNRAQFFQDHLLRSQAQDVMNRLGEAQIRDMQERLALTDRGQILQLIATLLSSAMRAAAGMAP